MCKTVFVKQNGSSRYTRMLSKLQNKLTTIWRAMAITLSTASWQYGFFYIDDVGVLSWTSNWVHSTCPKHLKPITIYRNDSELKELSRIYSRSQLVEAYYYHRDVSCSNGKEGFRPDAGKHNKTELLFFVGLRNVPSKLTLHLSWKAAPPNHLLRKMLQWNTFKRGNDRWPSKNSDSFNIPSHTRSTS